MRCRYDADCGGCGHVLSFPKCVEGGCACTRPPRAALVATVAIVLAVVTACALQRRMLRLVVLPPTASVPSHIVHAADDALYGAPGAPVECACFAAEMARYGVRDTFQHNLASTHTVLATDALGRYVGSCHVTSATPASFLNAPGVLRNELLYVHTLCCTASRRGHGVGSAILARVVAEFGRVPLLIAVAHPSSADDEAARTLRSRAPRLARLYGRHGFARIGRHGEYELYQRPPRE